MKIIKDMSEDIETTMDMAESNIKKAIQYKDEYPLVAKAYYAKSIALMDTIKGMHDGITALIKAYREQNGEPPVPMMAVYNYLHERHINQSVMIKNLQDIYTKN